jgi:hypothetical protein
MALVRRGTEDQHMPPFTIPSTSAAEELEHLRQLHVDRALASMAGDAELVGDLDFDIEAATDAFVGLAVTEIASLRGEIGGRDQG